MKLFEPQISLYRRLDNDEVFEYLLHVVTFMDNAKYSPITSNTPGIAKNESGTTVIELEVGIDEQFDVNALVPVVHKVTLSEFFPDTISPLIEVVVGIPGDRTIGKGIVHMDEADEVERPVPSAIF